MDEKREEIIQKLMIEAGQSPNRISENYLIDSSTPKGMILAAKESKNTWLQEID